MVVEKGLQQAHGNDVALRLRLAGAFFLEICAAVPDQDLLQPLQVGLLPHSRPGQAAEGLVILIGHGEHHVVALQLAHQRAQTGDAQDVIYPLKAGALLQDKLRVSLVDLRPVAVGHGQGQLELLGGRKFLPCLVYRLPQGMGEPGVMKDRQKFRGGEPQVPLLAVPALLGAVELLKALQSRAGKAALPLGLLPKGKAACLRLLLRWPGRFHGLGLGGGALRRGVRLLLAPGVGHGLLVGPAYRQKFLRVLFRVVPRRRSSVGPANGPRVPGGGKAQQIPRLHHMSSSSSSSSSSRKGGSQISRWAQPSSSSRCRSRFSRSWASRMELPD